MILEKQTENLVLSEGTSGDVIKSKLDIESADFLMRMMTKGFYSDAIGSTVRETASNGVDSHRKAGIDDPIVVTLSSNIQGNWEYSVEDVGVGLDHQTVIDVISMYGKSTKRDDANAIGCMGLGWKSPLSYTPSFYFIARKDGIERKYIQSEDEEGGSSIELLYEQETIERNGVKVIVPVKYSDRYDFVNSIKEQLAYFQGVYFNVDGVPKDFKIHRSEHFQWSELCEDKDLHICLDDVYYPIDFNKLGIGRIHIPVGLRFSLSDGIYPLPNRESIRYTTESKTVIFNKIKQVADYFVNFYNESVTETEDIEKIFDFFRYSDRKVKGFRENSTISIGDLTIYSSIKPITPTLKGIKKTDLQRVFHMKDSLFKEYTIKYKYSYGRFTGTGNSSYDREFNHQKATRNDKIYIFSGELSNKMKNYLRDDILTRGLDTLFIQKERVTRLGKIGPTLWGVNANTYIDILNLNKYPKSDWRDMIKEYQYIKSLYEAKFLKADGIIIPQEYINRKKLERQDLLVKKDRRLKLTGEINVKVASNLERYVSDKNCKFESVIFNLKEIHKDKKVTVYCENTPENAQLIQKWFTIINRGKTRFAMLSTREMKNIKGLNVHNWVKMEDFLKGKHIQFRRIVTAYLINNLIVDHYSSFAKKDKYISRISTHLYDNLTILENYKRDNFHSGNEELYKECVKLAESEKLFDYSVYYIYKEVKFTLEKLKFLEPVLAHVPYEDKGVIDALKDLFKYYKQKIDWKHYKLPIN